MLDDNTVSLFSVSSFLIPNSWFPVSFSDLKNLEKKEDDEKNKNFNG